MTRILAIGGLVAAGLFAVVSGGAYVAASAADSLAGTFATTESALHASRNEARSSIRRASAQYAKSLGQCERHKGAKRELCNAAARREEKRSVSRDTQPAGEAP